MRAPTVPPEEEQRLAALRGLHILDTPPEERFNRITRTAQHLFDVPIVLISLVDANRQWFKSCLGLPVSETPRSISFCGHAILQDAPLVIPDALLDERFADNPLVTGEPRIRFYAGYPLRHSGGSRLGTLCLIDRRPRVLSERDLAALHDLGSWAESELNILSTSSALAIKHESEARLNAVLDGVTDGIITIDEQGTIESFSRAATRIFGYSLAEVQGKNVSMLMPEPYRSEHDGYLHNYVTTGHAKIIGIGREVEGRRKDGERFPLELAVSEVRLESRRIFAGIVRDVSGIRLTERELRDTTRLQQAILDGANLTIISTDVNGTILTFNAAAQRILG
ncbi:MAG: PAS domain S-box protein [Gammaproteobacteria bacterium]|nr:PAS domain S-box protein [Gammaproteobacteria bacterium]